VIDRIAGPEAAFLLGAATALAAVLVAAMVMPARLPRQVPAAAQQRSLLDFRPVFRNRAAMGWIVGYTVHTWELAALRAWGVTFSLRLSQRVVRLPGCRMQRSCSRSQA
jgi:hypothetical protein